MLLFTPYCPITDKGYRMQRKQVITSIVVLVILFLILSILFIWQYVRSEMIRQYAKIQKQPVAAVEIQRAEAKVWHPLVQAVGSVQAIQGVDVTTQITGKVTKIYFESGQTVKQGDPLIQLDDSTYQADLENATAAYTAAQLDFNRSTRLFKTKTISQAAYDQALSTFQQTKSMLDKAQAILNQTLIKAPFDGKLGLRQVSLGQYINTGDAAVNLQQMNPLYVNFELPQAYLQQVQVGNNIQVTTESYPNQMFKGKIIAVNSTFNTVTRMLEVQATLNNDKAELIPGMFVNVNVIVPIKLNVMVVPVMAVNYSPFGDTIFKVVNNKAEQEYVKVGEQRGEEVAVTGKLEDGDMIVTVGAYKLQDGQPLKIVNSSSDLLSFGSNTGTQQPEEESPTLPLPTTVVPSKTLAVPPSMINQSATTTTTDVKKGNP